MATDRDLAEYPRPGVGVDLALLTVVGTSDTSRLCVLVQDRTSPTGRALPGRFLRDRQTIAAATEDILRLKVGITPPTAVPRLLRVFDDPGRDDRTWTISAAHALALPPQALTGATGDLVPVTAAGHVTEKLLFDHDAIVREAVAVLRERYEIRKKYRDVRPDPDGFLTGPITLAQLRRVHETVLGAELPKDSFNRRMLPLLEPVRRRDGSPVTGSGSVGRPAQVYRVKREH